MAAAKQPSPLSNGETVSCRYYCPLHSANTKKNHLAAPAVKVALLMSSWKCDPRMVTV